MRSSLGDREKIATEAAEAEEKYESARRQVAELEELAQVITSMIQILVTTLIWPCAYKTLANNSIEVQDYIK